MRSWANLRFGLFSVAAAALVAGCATPYPYGPTYPGYQANRAQTVEMGVVDSVRPVNVQGPNSGVGTVTGATLGGIGGYQLGGSSNANAAGAIAGALIGGILGTAIEQDANRRPGVEVGVRLDSGRSIAVVQDASEPFRTGDRVRVVSDGYVTRVTH
jgi:outer membrane lipoprotein SlyB